jgi:hypothetical protein
MRRLFWFGLGAGLGAWGMHKFTRLTRSFTPRGVTARAAGVGERLRSYATDIRAEIRAEMTAREAELRSMLRESAVEPAAPRGRHARTPNGRILDDDKDGH